MLWMHVPVLCPFPFPVHMPPPSFLFLFWGHRNFLFSSQFKMACWSQLEAQWRAGHPWVTHGQTMGRPQREGQGNSVLWGGVGGGRAH